MQILQINNLPFGEFFFYGERVFIRYNNYLNKTDKSFENCTNP